MPCWEAALGGPAGPSLVLNPSAGASAAAALAAATLPMPHLQACPSSIKAGCACAILLSCAWCATGRRLCAQAARGGDLSLLKKT
eukprot:scaffold58652_cov18-Tisochrysis_lutea.AAC.1